ncbi:hypothetical protein ACEYW6_23315 [Nostoc sp. UIC 10607]
MIVLFRLIKKPVEANSFQVTQQQTIRVLFIGNSYTYVNDLPWLTATGFSTFPAGRLRAACFIVGVRLRSLLSKYFYNNRTFT